jgi:hypothetical protein
MVSRLGIAIGEQLVEPLLADLIAGRLAKGVFARFSQPLAPVIQYGLKRALAGAGELPGGRANR